MEQQLLDLLANMGGGVGAAVPVFAYLFIMWRRQQQATQRQQTERDREHDERHREYTDKINSMAVQVQWLYDESKGQADYERRRVEEKLRALKSRSDIKPPGGAGEQGK
jgi:tRNA C32,U32 (ribose-2'-O)-methylase TrmJ